MRKHYLSRAQFPTLLKALADLSYEVVGPQVKNGAILFDTLTDVDALPKGIQEVTEAGQYRLNKEPHDRYFAWNTGPQSIKPWLFQPQQTLWRAEPASDGFRFKQTQPEIRQLAFIGVRACDIAALYIQDKHFLHGQHPDPWYKEQRHKLCLIAVNCSRSASTCFCLSTGDGPEVSYGYDLLLDELDDGFLLQAKSEKGFVIISKLSLETARDEQLKLATQQTLQAASQQKALPQPERLMELLNHLNDQQWQAIAQRCLACGNCTSVCPTCFCSKQESEVVGSGTSEQVRYWDSCFSQQYGFIAGKRIREEISQRYRQWMIHKLVTWQQQYGRSGCVGCGRCISWCPAAIDLVDEVNAMLGSEK